MKRHKALVPISREHHQMLLLAQLLKKDAPLYRGLPEDTEGKALYAWQQWKEFIKLHFKREEECIFALVRNKSGEIRNLCKQLISEHLLMKEKFEQLMQRTDKEEWMDQLGKLLESHIRNEERVLFEKIQETLNEDEMQLLEMNLEGNGGINVPGIA